MPAGPAQAFGTGDPLIQTTGMPGAGPAVALGAGEIVHGAGGMPLTAATVFGAADVIHGSLPPEELITITGMPQAAPADAFFTTPALLIKTIGGMPEVAPAQTFQSVHHDVVHIADGIAPAGPAEAFGTGIVVYVNSLGNPGINASGMAAAGPALPIGPLWNRPEHMIGLVFPQSIPAACPLPLAEAPQSFVNYPNSGVIFGPADDRCMRSDYDPVKRLTVEGCYHLAVDKSIKVSWALRRDFTEPGPYTFELYRGRAINADHWEKIAQVQDQSWIFDRRPKPRPHERSTYYRLRITDGEGVTYWCHPVSFDTIWNHYDWRLVKEIVRKELLIQGRRNGKARARGAGTRGWLLKKRQFGDPCTTCLDTNTGVSTNANCPECFGTTVVGGFYDPLEYWVIQQPAMRSTKLSDAGDTRTVVIESVRALAHPSPEAGDIWVSAAGDIRYEIQGDIERLARHRGVDVILGLRLLELPTTHAAYDIPIEDMCRV